VRQSSVSVADWKDYVAHGNETAMRLAWNADKLPFAPHPPAMTPGKENDLTIASDGLRARKFTGAFLVNKDSSDQAALKARIESMRADGRCRVPNGAVQLLTRDANRLIGRIMGEIHPKAYALVFADITRPSHWQWTSVQQLKSAGHESVDLYLLFPWGMALQRMLSFNSDAVEQSAPVLDAFFGTTEWRTLLAKRVTSTQSPEFAHSVVEYYMARMRALGWKHVVVARDIRRDDNVGLYKMLYASNHSAGGNIADWSANRPQDGQNSLF
jgi:three-Cys-motif partner protein